jgi:hypothetical protein
MSTAKTVNTVPDSDAFVARKQYQNYLIVEMLKRFGIVDVCCFVLDDIGLATSCALIDAGIVTDPSQIDLANIGGCPNKWIKDSKSAAIVAAARKMYITAVQTDALSYLRYTGYRGSFFGLDACCSLKNIIGTAKYAVANCMVPGPSGCAALWITGELTRTKCHEKSSEKPRDEIVMDYVKELAEAAGPCWKSPVVLHNHPDPHGKMQWLGIVFELANHPIERYHRIRGRETMVMYKRIPVELGAASDFMSGIAYIKGPEIIYEWSDGTRDVSAGALLDVTTDPFEGAVVDGETEIPHHPAIDKEFSKKFRAKKKGPLIDYKGKVTRVFTDSDGTFCSVVYEDGDTQDMPLEELEKLLLKRTEPSAKKQKKEE